MILNSLVPILLSMRLTVIRGHLDLAEPSQDVRASQKSGNREMRCWVLSAPQTPDIPNRRWPHPETKKPQSRNSEADLKRSLSTLGLATAAEEQAEDAEAKKHQARWLWNDCRARELKVG